MGNRTTLTDVDGANDYFHDALNRPSQAAHPQATNPAESFTYDPVGNRTSSHLATGQLHDAANRLLGDSNFTYTYDANGNLTEKIGKGTGDRTVYIYDAENQLIRVEQFTVAGGTTPVLVAEYRYDALGRRIKKDVNRVITRYIYDNEDILLEVDGTGITQALYLHGPGIDEPLAVFRSGGRGGLLSYHADGLGSIATLTDASGAPAQTYTYDSFGQIVDQTGSVSNPYTYTAREFDPETGLFYYRARYYDPTTGRFLQEDPLFTLNLYAYARNNSVNFSDPSGLQAPGFNPMGEAPDLTPGYPMFLLPPNPTQRNFEAAILREPGFGFTALKKFNEELAKALFAVQLRIPLGETRQGGVVCRITRFPQNISIIGIRVPPSQAVIFRTPRPGQELIRQFNIDIRGLGSRRR